MNPGGWSGSIANDALALRDVDEVVVCSPALAESRGRRRPVHVITNGVDVDHLRSPTERPADLPPGRIVLYQGTLSDGRLDIGLCVSLARTLSGRATLVFLGPNSLSKAAESEVLEAGAVILGSRPYAAMPAYLQHADVLVVPHQVIPFTESLDPIKAREFQAVGRPVVATPVAGFRDLGPPSEVAEPDAFVERGGGGPRPAAAPARSRRAHRGADHVGGAGGSVPGGDGQGGGHGGRALGTTVQVTDPDPTNPDPTNPDPTTPDPTTPHPTNPGRPTRRDQVRGGDPSNSSDGSV